MTQQNSYMLILRKIPTSPLLLRGHNACLQPRANGGSSWLSFFPPWFMPTWYSLLSHGVKLGKWWEPSGRTLRFLRLRPKGGDGGLVAKPCLTLCNPKDHSLPGSSVHGIFQTRIPLWVAISFSRGSSQPRHRTHVSSTTRRTTKEALDLKNIVRKTHHQLLKRFLFYFFLNLHLGQIFTSLCHSLF